MEQPQHEQWHVQHCPQQCKHYKPWDNTWSVLVVRLVLLQVCHFPVVAAFSIHSVYHGCRGETSSLSLERALLLFCFCCMGEQSHKYSVISLDTVSALAPVVPVAVTPFWCFDQFEFGPA